MHIHVFIYMLTHILQRRSGSSDMSLKAAHSLNYHIKIQSLQRLSQRYSLKAPPPPLN